MRAAAGKAISAALAPAAQAVVTVAIPPDAEHAGAGAACVDGAFSEQFLSRLEALFERLEVGNTECAARKNGKNVANTDVQRKFFCDALCEFSIAITEAIKLHLPTTGCSSVHALMRLLHYPDRGDRMVPHVDLSKKDLLTGAASTHTFLLYLSEEPGEVAGEGEEPGAAADGNALSGGGGGGETALLRSIGKPGQTAASREAWSRSTQGVMHLVAPRRGRLFVFPHACPHAGRPVSCRKLLLRGEAV